MIFAPQASHVFVIFLTSLSIGPILTYLAIVL